MRVPFDIGHVLLLRVVDCVATFFVFAVLGVTVAVNVGVELAVVFQLAQ